MAFVSKRISDLCKKVDAEKLYELGASIELLKSLSGVKFVETVDIAVNLCLDLSKTGAQSVKGSVSLPHGVGKVKRVIAFVTPDRMQEALDAGAVRAGGVDLIDDVKGGYMDFDYAIALPSMMQKVRVLGTALGPKGLMPNPKLGTVTDKIQEAVSAFVKGRVQYKSDRGGVVHMSVGCITFESQQLVENVVHALQTLDAERYNVDGFKGHMIKNVFISSTMSVSLRVKVPAL